MRVDDRPFHFGDFWGLFGFFILLPYFGNIVGDAFPSGAFWTGCLWYAAAITFTAAVAVPTVRWAAGRPGFPLRLPINVAVVGGILGMTMLPALDELPPVALALLAGLVEGLLIAAPVHARRSNSEWRRLQEEGTV
jgi:hypothetical protein